MRSNNRRQGHFWAAIVLTAGLGVAASSLGVPALAADLGADTAEDYGSDPLSHWRGGYVGLTLGASGAGANISRGSGKDLELGSGALGLGAVAGYNFTPSGGSSRGGFLWGFEADIASLGGSDKKNDGVLGTAKFNANWLASARLRAGYAWERLYIYGTAGLAVSDIEAFDRNAKKNGTDLRAGLAYGLGAEYAFSENWSGRLEGIAYGFGDADQEFSGVKRKTELGAATIRLGITHKF